MLRAIGFGVLSLGLAACGQVIETRDLPTDEPKGFEPTLAAAEPATPKPPPSLRAAPPQHGQAATPVTPPVVAAPNVPLDPPYSGLPYCAGRSTTRFALVANFDRESTEPTFEWDPNDPANTSNFSTTVSLFTREGNPLIVDIYFARQPGSAVRYHAVIGNSARTRAGIEVGSGRLDFDEDGALLSVTDVQGVSLPGPHGFEGEVEFWFGTPLDAGGTGRDGVVFDAGPSNVTKQTQDGEEAVLGHSCQDAPRPENRVGPPVASSSAELCLARATTTVAVRANLGGESFAMKLEANDDTGMNGEFELNFRKSSAGTWDYHVGLVSEVPQAELANGSLSFDENGTLAAVQVARELRFPTLDGSPGPVIRLDFGTPRVGGSGGVDGVTAFVMAGVVIDWTQDGHRLLFGRCPAPT